MKLKEFNADNCSSVRGSTTPTINIHTKTGVFALNKMAVELVGLKNGDQIQILQDEEEPENWYLEKVKSNGFVIRYGGGEWRFQRRILQQFSSCKTNRRISSLFSFKRKNAYCWSAN